MKKAHKSNPPPFNRREAEQKVKGTEFPCGVWGKAPTPLREAEKKKRSFRADHEAVYD